MKSKVRIGDSWVGDGEPCFVVAEIGVNRNGSLDTARKRENPFGSTNGDLKLGSATACREATLATRSAWRPCLRRR
jgi:hypothetical protein